jgi:hypothetical protein
VLESSFWARSANKNFTNSRIASSQKLATSGVFALLTPCIKEGKGRKKMIFERDYRKMA